MVLENASDSAGGQPYGDVPSSETDPYAYNRQEDLQQRLRTIDASRMPRPMPLFGTLFGYNQARSLNFTESRLKELQRLLGRLPTPEETDAVAYVSFKAVSIMSYQPPVCIAAGLWRAYQTAGSYRFPFYQPNLDTFNPEAFPLRSGPLKGFRAVIGWHLLRAVPYAISGMFFGGLFFTSYAASVSTARVVSDPRLKEFTEALREEATKTRNGSLQKVPGQSSKPGQQHGAPRSGDDASPIGATWETDESLKVEQTLPPSVSPRPWPKVRPVPEQSQPQSPRDQSFDAFDDVSPTVGQGSNENMTVSTQQIGSAWDRIRRGEKPSSTSQRSSQNAWSKQQQSIQDEQQEGSTPGDSFAFSKTDEERAYAKQDAQKEFDARVERERRGGDFSQGNGDQKRW